jgi:hypothetical protein
MKLINLNDYRENKYFSAGIKKAPCYGEDGVILKIFREIGVSDSPFCIEFGELRSLGTTTRAFRLEYCAGAIYFSGTLDLRSRVLNILDILKICIFKKSLKFLKFFRDMPFQAWISVHNTMKFLPDRIPSSVDLLVVDIDSFDFEVVKNILEGGIRPTVFVVEYNPSLGSEQAIFLSEHASKKHYANKRIYGASYKAWLTLFSSHDYKLVHISGFCNLFFVKREFASIFQKPNIEEEITNTNDKVWHFINSWCLPGFVPTWLGSPRIGIEELECFTAMKSL